MIFFREMLLAGVNHKALLIGLYGYDPGTFNWRYIHVMAATVRDDGGKKQ